MTQNVYECLFILDSNRFARDPNAVDSQITEMIERRGGEVLISRRWNEQKLAFPINGHRKAPIGSAISALIPQRSSTSNEPVD